MELMYMFKVGLRICDSRWRTHLYSMTEFVAYALFVKMLAEVVQCVETGITSSLMLLGIGMSS